MKKKGYENPFYLVEHTKDNWRGHYTHKLVRHGNELKSPYAIIATNFPMTDTNCKKGYEFTT